VAFSLLRYSWGHGIRAALERFDWRSATALRKKDRRKWDAIKQLIRYKEVVGRDVPISAEAIRTGMLFIDPSDPAK
jgi:hypothetical protein